MTVRRFQLNVDDPTYSAMVDRAQAEGKQVDQVLEDLLEAYANSQTAGFTTYTVQGGDTLSQISRKVYGDPYKYPVILHANQLDTSGKIFVGQVLVIPTITPAGAAPAPVPVPSVPAPSPQPVPSPVPVPVPAAGPTMADYVNAMPKGFRADRAGNLQATYQFQLAGSSTWTVYVANGSCSVAEGGTPLPSVGIGMSGDDFIKLAQGRLDTTQAYRQGRVKIGGDLNLAARIADIFGPWAQFVSGGAVPAPQPAPTTPAPSPTVPAPVPAPGGTINPTLLNGSFDDYQPFMRDGQPQYWKESRFPEEYGQHWDINIDREKKGRTHIVSSKTFGEFTAKYFGGGGRDYHIHGRHSQVVTSQYFFDVIFSQTVAAQPGKSYTFSGAIVSFYKGTSGERADGKIFKTIGIDPVGGRDFESSTVVWGDRDGKDNEWRYPSLRVTAQSQAITVFIRLENVEENVGQTELNIVHLENFTLG